MAVTHHCCPRSFWQVFETLLEQPTTLCDQVLTVVYKLLGPKCAPRQRWPRSCRSLREIVTRRTGSFWELVTETHTIDLTRFALPNVTSVQFTFVDPIFEWVQRANALHTRGVVLQWDPCVLRHPDTNEESFGAGIECGLLFRDATARIPTTSKVALINLSWDGGNLGYGSRSATPICIQVMNTNDGSNATVGLLGYLPHLEVPEGYKNADLARHHLVQVSPLHICAH